MKSASAFLLYFAALAAAEEAEPQKDFGTKDIQGFVFQAQGGLWLDDGEAPMPDDLVTIIGLDPVTRCGGDWSPPHFSDPTPLGKVRPGKDSPNFEDYLRNGASADTLPRNWARVRIRMTGEFLRPEGEYEIVEVLAQEEISEAWLLAWRELDRVNVAVKQALTAEDWPRSRAEVEKLAKRQREAIDAARMARSKGELKVLELTRERQWAQATAALLRRVGLGDGLPEYPDDRELGQAFLKCESREKFKADFVGRYGVDAMLESMWIVHPVVRDGETDHDGDWFKMQDLFAMTDRQFLELRDGARGTEEKYWAAQRERTAWPWPVASEDDDAVLGARVAQLTDEECAKLLVVCGAKIVSMKEGGAAAKSGLKAGDVILTVDVDVPDNVGYIYRRPIVSPGRLQWVLGQPIPEEEDGWPFRVLRDGELVTEIVKK